MNNKIKIAIFGSHQYEMKPFLDANEQYDFDLRWLDARLTESTKDLVNDFDVVCSFVEDKISKPVLEKIASTGTKLIALRSAGYNHVDIQAADELNVKVVRVPSYSPNAIAEFTVALILNSSRKIHKSYQRVRDNNFSIEGLVGFNLHKKKIGVLGTGQIGKAFCKIMLGFDSEVYAYDLIEDPELIQLGVQYVSQDKLMACSDIISLHLPLNSDTQHILDGKAFSAMKDGVVIINTSRGGLIDTKSLIKNLKSGKVKSVALDVYEEEEGIFFEDHSNEIIQDDLLMRLTTFPNVIVTSHQAFLTEEALSEIAKTTLDNINEYLSTGTCRNLIG